MPSKSVSLHYRVNLQQRTGEDWNDAKLTLSTSATDMLNAGVPAPDSLTIQPKEKPQPPPLPPPGSTRTYHTARKLTSALFTAPPPQPCMTVSAAQAGMAHPPIVITPLIETAAKVSKSPMAVNYTVDESTTIPSDRLSHKVLVAIIPFEATISHITSPRKSPIAYLQVGTRLSVQLGTEHRPYLPDSVPSKIRVITTCFLEP